MISSLLNFISTSAEGEIYENDDINKHHSELITSVNSFKEKVYSFFPNIIDFELVIS